MTQTFYYKAIDSAGKFHCDSIKSNNSLELEKHLNAMGLELIRFKKTKPTFHLFSQFKKPRLKISRRELINFTFQMQQLQKSGVSILDSLSDLKDSTQHMPMKHMLSAINHNIHNGKTFSQALQEFSSVFNPVYISLIKVGEETGRLAEVMHSIAENLKWQDELIARTQKLMIYPAIVSIIIISVVSYLMIFLVPELIPFIEELGGIIPLHTRALIVTSELLQAYYYLIFGIPIILIILIKNIAKRNTSLRYFIDRKKLQLYLIGPIILKSHLARFSHYFAMMYASGLNILDSLKIAESLMGNAVLEKSITEIREHIIQGDSLSNSFSRYEIYPALIIRMLKIGETTGAVDEALLNISYFYNREVQESVDKMEAAITPLLTLIMGGIMLWIMSAVLSPIYDSLNRIG